MDDVRLEGVLDVNIVPEINISELINRVATDYYSKQKIKT